MKEITSRKNGFTQFVTDEEWQWLVKRHRARDFTVVEMKPPKMLSLPKLLTKEIIKPKTEGKEIPKTKKTKK
ncbi:MAG: hypothetical protein M0P71_12980 [Melioribacteraceae bacterium]|jgi:hypothetical protein|nr:hypothetical protein [Melioribacteraceae bacterium]